jgi:hypothetical protein
MNIIEKANELFGKDYNHFEETDPFNPKNKVKGVISRKSNEFYGALIISHVNDKEVNPQLIYSSPKMHYPFDTMADGTRRYKFPSAKDIEVYEKLDGTCVIAYSYTDDVYKYFTYKTRLRPFLASGKFGDFYNMWKEVATPYMPVIKKLLTEKQCNLVFELWGARNPHLVVYKELLTFSLLFGVTNTGRILSPRDLLGDYLVWASEKVMPVARTITEIKQNYVWNYEEMQKVLQNGLKKEEEGYYSGMEGTVWYLKTADGRCIQFKCKPETIEAIHFSAGAGGLCRNVVLATCWNAYENVDTLTTEFIKQLLFEEFKPEIVEANHYLIERCVIFIEGEMLFRQKVLEEYRALGKNILLEKVETMRALSTKFERNKMKKVYTVIMNFG